MRRLLPILFISFTFAGFSQTENFNQAKLHLANHKLQQAIPILEKLWAKDPSNANLNYLLGLCYVKGDKEIAKSVELLEAASSMYAKNYEAGSNKERRAPEYVYYYLTIAYSKNGQCKEALRSLNKFYQVYSYQDEYYLVDGQKWVRECNLLDKDEEVEQPPIARTGDDEPVVQEQPVATAHPIMSEEQMAGKEIAEEIKEERTAPKIKDRLIPFDDWENLRTREVNYTSMNSQYGVQIAALIELKPTRDFPELKNVEVYVDENGIFRYVIGRFPYRKQAEALRDKIRERGYADAFIVDINQPDYVNEVLGIGAENISWNIQGRVDFKVQVGAFRTLVSSAVADKYLEVEGIKEVQQNDLTILTVGSFAQYDEAASYREELKTNGIGDAFVVAFNHGNKIPLDEAKSFAESHQKEQRESHVKEKPKRERADF